MTDPRETPEFDDVIDPTEPVPRTRREHGKMPPRLDDDELAARTEHERQEVHPEDYPDDDIPDAEV